MDKLIPLLEEIRDNQRKQIEISEEALQFTKDNIHRAEKIQKGAEALQATAGKILFRIILPTESFFPYSSY